MNYTEAMEAVSNYKTLRRPHWPANSSIVESMDSSIILYSNDREPQYYYPSEEDRNATDWEFRDQSQKRATETAPVKQIKPIEPSMTVSLISGGPIMTVVYTTPRSAFESPSTYADGDTVNCQWFDKLDNLHEGRFYTSLLTPSMLPSEAQLVSGLK